MAKIVIIDDTQVLAQMYATRLGSEGHSVTIFNNGTDGLHYVKQNKPDLLILDVMLPGENGEDVLTLLRSLPDFKTVPIVIFSNLSDPEKQQKLLSLGATDFINKSMVTPTEVVGKITKYL